MNEYLIKILKDNNRLENEAEIERFLFALDLLRAQKHTVSLLPRLFEVFTDAAHYSEVMRSLVSVLETFDLEDYVKALLDSTVYRMNQAEKWYRLMYRRILNDEKTRTYARLYLQALDAHHQSAVKQMLKQIAEEKTEQPDVDQNVAEYVRFVLEA
jgi:hypothetical protein